MVSCPGLEDKIKKECSLRLGDFIPLYGAIQYNLRTVPFDHVDQAVIPCFKGNIVLLAYSLALSATILYAASNLFK